MTHFTLATRHAEQERQNFELSDLAISVELMLEKWRSGEVRITNNTLD